MAVEQRLDLIQKGFVAFPLLTDSTRIWLHGTNRWSKAGTIFNLFENDETVAFWLSKPTLLVLQYSAMEYPCEREAFPLFMEARLENDDLKWTHRATIMYNYQ